MVARAMTVDRAAAPTERAVAGLSTFVSCEVSFDELSERYFCRCSLKTSLPRGPFPFLASSTRLGMELPKCVALVTSGSANR